MTKTREKLALCVLTFKVILEVMQAQNVETKTEIRGLKNQMNNIKSELDN